MNTFVYRAKDEKGNMISGVLEADNKKILRKKIYETGYYLMDAQVKKSKRGLFLFEDKVKLDTLIMFTQQLAAMLESGLPILKCLEVMWREINHSKMQIIISQLRNKLNSGSSISAAMREFPDVFPYMYCTLLTVAETGAGLVPILKKLLEYLCVQKDVVRRVKKACIYPLIVVAVSILVVFLMLLFVVPTFQKVFLKTKVALPFVTQIVVNLSAAAKNPYSWMTIGGLIFTAWFLYKKMLKVPKFRLRIDRVKAKLPVFGKLFYTLSLSRFVRSLSLLLAGGLPLIKSIEIAKTVVVNREIERSLEWAQKRIITGGFLSEAIRETRAFPSILVEMIAVGEHSGRLAELLEKVAAHFEEEINIGVNKYLTMLEPFLILFVGGIVMFILLAVYLPVLKLWQILPGG
jgi:type IV pilus assembly protein PilC